jgi:hypothetical protein
VRVAEVATDALADIPSRPASILRGKNGSAIEGRAAPIKSWAPEAIWLNMVSGEVKRPTLTTGLLVSALRRATTDWQAASLTKRELPISRW